MRSKNKEKTHKKLAIFLGIIWGIMLVVYLRSVYGIFHYDESRIYYSDATYLAGDIVVGNYGSLYSRIDSMVGDGADFTEHPEYSELAAIHDYMEALTLYRMYSENGIEDLAAKNLARMDEARSRMGGLDFAAEDLNKILAGD